MKKLILVIFFLACISLFSQTENNQNLIKLPVVITKVTAHGQNKNDWMIQVEQTVNGVLKTKFYKINSPIILYDVKYVFKDISTENINSKNVFTVTMQRNGGKLILAKVNEDIFEFDELQKDYIYSDGKNEYDLRKTSLAVNVDKSTGRKTGYTPSIGDYGRISGKVFQVIDDNKIIIKSFDSLLAVNGNGIGKDTIDDQDFDNVILRVGTYKTTSILGGGISIPDCVILERK